MFRNRHLSVFLVFIGLFLFSNFVLADQQKKVIITYQDASELKVTDFQFFTNHRPVRGFYMKSTSDRATDLLIKTGRLWKIISPKEIKLIKMDLDSKKRFFNTELELKNSEKLRGTFPIKFEETGYISFRDKITRIYGTISKTEVLFDEIYSLVGFNIKSIKF